MTEPTQFPFKTIMPMALATMLSVFAMGLVIPIMPYYIIVNGGLDYQAPYLFSVFSLCALISAPLWGRLSDIYGRKAIIMMAMMFTILSYALLLWADEMWMLFAARALAGLAAGWMAAGQAFIADVTSKEQRAKGMGLMGAAFGIGFTLGPGLSAFLVGDIQPENLMKSHLFWPLLLSVILAAASFMAIAVFLPRNIKQTPIAEKKRKWVELWISPALKDHPILIRYLVLYLSVFIVFTAMEGAFAIWAAARLGYGPYEVGMVLSYGGAITIFIQGGLIGRMVKSIGEENVVRIALIALMAGLLSLALAQSLWMLIIGMSFLALAMGFHNPGMQSLISRAAPTEVQGAIMGSAQSANSLGRVLGPAWAALAFQYIGVTAPFWIGVMLLVFIIPVAFMTILKRGS